MIHEPAKFAGWQSTSAAAQHLDRLKQMQSQIYRILADRSGKPLRQIIRDTKRTDFYLDAVSAREYGLIDEVLGPIEASRPERSDASYGPPADSQEAVTPPSIAASEHPTDISPR
jgi:ATP-dependent protease ClpP protease subunit